MPVRNPAVVGQFYDANPERLRISVEHYLQKTADPLILPEMQMALPPLRMLETEPVAARCVLLPHAGYVYSGRVAGQTLARVCLPDTLVILCPNHTGQGAPLAVWPEGGWRTPLGEVPLDQTVVEALLALQVNEKTLFTADTTAHMREHSLEVILPFLQVHTPQACIVPIAVRCDVQTLQHASIGLAAVIAEQEKKGHTIGIVVSSDMNHFKTLEETILRDAAALIPLLEGNPMKLLQTVFEQKISMCGVLPAALAFFALLHLAEKTQTTPPKPTLIAYETSATMSNDTKRVVGYAGLVLG